MFLRFNRLTSEREKLKSFNTVKSKYGRRDFKKENYNYILLCIWDQNKDSKMNLHMTHTYL